MPHVLGIDASTQSITAILLDLENGKILAEKSVNFGQELPGYEAPHGYIKGGKNGEVHADPLMWLDGLDLLLEEMQAEGVDFSHVKALSGAGQQHGSVYLNENWFAAVKKLDARHDLSDQLKGCLSRRSSPIWMDSSTGAECAEIAESLGGHKRVCEISGSYAIERFTGPQIRRFAKIDPEGYARTARIHLVSSFMASVFAGEDAPIDTGDGAGMNLMNLEKLQWDKKLLEATAEELDGRLPELVPSGTIIGRISPYFSRYGFKEDVVIVAFTGDNNSSLVGMGASRPGKVVISLGTSDTFFAAMPEPLTDPNGFGHVFGNPVGGYMTLQCFRNGSLAREKVKEEFGLSWQQFDVEAFREQPAGNNGNLMLPFYEPEITPRVNTNGPVFVGSEAFRNHPEPYARVRACVEGQIMNMWHHAQWMGLKPEEILLTGGAAKGPGIAQSIADIFGARVLRLDVSSSVGLGAALRAAATGMDMSLRDLEAIYCAPVEGSKVLPDPSTRDAYAALASKFAEAVAQL